MAEIKNLNLGFEDDEGNGSRPFQNTRQSVTVPVVYTWENINVSVDVKEDDSLGRKLHSVFRKSTAETNHILKNVSGLVSSGEILAVIGASGAGKTTLLNALSFRDKRTANISGSRRLNGEEVNGKIISTISAYIQQKDIFIGCLTPREHLLFQARLRMHRSTTAQQRETRVKEILHELSLTRCADTVIGDPGQLKGISGGERKRLSIASEIVTDARLVFLDEPTTGLDSYMAENVLYNLKELASRGRAIICTIHQPSSQVFAMFNRLLIMSEGRNAFLGDCENALDFFSSQGFECPINFNPAEFYIKTLAGKFGERCSESSVILNAYEKEIEPSIKQQIAKSLKRKDILKSDFSKSASTYKTHWWTQYSTCLSRAVKTILKDPLTIYVQLAQNLIISIFCGLLFFRQEMDQKGIQNINGFLFILIAFLTFSSIFPVANVFWEEFPIFMREKGSRMYTTSAYYLAKSTAELPVYVLQPIIFTSISYYMVGLNPDSDRFFTAIAIAVLLSNVGVSYGFMVSTISNSLPVTLALAPLFISPLFILGGTFQNANSVPAYLEWLPYLSWYLHGNEALSINQWKGIEKIECRAESQQCLVNGDDVLFRLGFEQDEFLFRLIMLGALVVGARIIAFIGLLFKSWNV